ncbi:hypothetical protein AB0N07_44635 [Streptomyces sp. NPDC051172]|uniref:hypothetical protein n=1 Tax=Streptomyces sp. NPDC051172 TaxID=3155796 RepID=UPI00343655A3
MNRTVQGFVVRCDEKEAGIMAAENPAPPERKRLQKRNYDVRQARAQALALVGAEYALRGERSGLDVAPAPVEDMRRAFRRWVREMFSGGRGGGGAGAMADGERQEPGGAAQDPGQTRSDTVRALSEAISRLSLPQRKAVENAVLELLRKSPYREAYDDSPMSMPYAARLANEAFAREWMGAASSGSERFRRTEPSPPQSGAPETESPPLEPARPSTATSEATLVDQDELYHPAAQGIPSTEDGQLAGFHGRWGRQPQGQQVVRDGMGVTDQPPGPASPVPAQSNSLVGPLGREALRQTTGAVPGNGPMTLGTKNPWRDRLLKAKKLAR